MYTNIRHESIVAQYDKRIGQCFFNDTAVKTHG